MAFGEQRGTPQCSSPPARPPPHRLLPRPSPLARPAASPLPAVLRLLVRVGFCSLAISFKANCLCLSSRPLLSLHLGASFSVLCVSPFLICRPSFVFFFRPLLPSSLCSFSDFFSLLSRLFCCPHTVFRFTLSSSLPPPSFFDPFPLLLFVIGMCFSIPFGCFYRSFPGYLFVLYVFFSLNEARFDLYSFLTNS